MLAPRLPRPSRGFIVLASAGARRATVSVHLPPPRAAIAVVAIAAGRRRPFSSTRPRRGPDPHEHLRYARPLVPHAIARRFSDAGRSRNSQAFVVACVVAAVAFYLYNSQTVPVTGRRRFNFLSDKLVAQAHVRAADAVIRQVQEQGGTFLVRLGSADNAGQTSHEAVDSCERHVGSRLGDSRHCRQSYVSSSPRFVVRLLLISRSFRLAGTANAFVLPGGKVFVHSGLLNVCRNEDALAAVLGHEIAHNTASHAAERLSAAWVGNLTAGSVFFLAGALPGLALFGLWSFVGGFYLQDLLFYLPMGRKQESEADYIGLMMMAEACYDPPSSGGFSGSEWRRFSTPGARRYPRC